MHFTIGVLHGFTDFIRSDFANAFQVSPKAHPIGLDIGVA
jgi:hypothetical protein